MGTLLSRLQELVDSNAPAALVTLVRVSDPIGPAVGAKLLVSAGGLVWGTSGREALDRILVRDAIGELAAGHNATRHYGPDGQHGADGISAFIEVFAPPPRMIIFGAVDFTAALASASKFLGYDVTVCDARSAFATEARFPMADRVIVDWPDRYLASLAAPLGARDAVCVLTHDAKFDVPALVTAVTSGVGYVAAWPVALVVRPLTISPAEGDGLGCRRARFHFQAYECSPPTDPEGQRRTTRMERRRNAGRDPHDDRT